MKKVLSVVLAVAMVLGCVASLAFVTGDQSAIPTPTNSALKVEAFHVTEASAMKASTQVNVYTDLVNLDGSPYAKNNVITFALDLAVYNPNYLPNGVVHTPTSNGAVSGQGSKTTLTIKSDTVSFIPAMNSMTLYKPYVPEGLEYITNMQQAVVWNAGATGKNSGIRLDDTTGDLEVDIYYFTQTSRNPGGLTPEFASEKSGFYSAGIYLYGVSKSTLVTKTDYTLVFSGITTGEMTQEGIVTVEREDKAGDTFDDAVGGKGIVTVERNGRTYRIKKTYDNDHSSQYNVDGALEGTLLWKTRMSDYDDYSNIYVVDAVGYRVDVLLSDPDGKLDTNDEVWGIIGRFETEQIRWSDFAPKEMQGKDVEGVGHSLGFDYHNGTTWVRVATDSLNSGRYYKLQDGTFATDEEVYRLDNKDFLHGSIAGYDANNNNELKTYGVSARQALNNFMSDFGLSTGDTYTYKVEDSKFVEDTTYLELGEATYNGNAIVIEQPEEDPDVEEPTGDEEIPDEGDIDEEPIPDEPIPDENPEPVPETGDASAAVAVALTAAALVAAAGLAVVLKKAR